MGQCSVLGCTTTRVYQGVLQCTTVYHGVPVCTTVYYGVPGQCVVA